MASVTRRQVMAWRLKRQHLVDPDAPGAIAVARRLCGVQAQVLSSAGQACRLRGADDDVDALLGSGALVRTWAMRGTLHLLPADDAGTWLSLVAAARTWTKGPWQKAFLTADRVELLAGTVTDLLADGRAATREDLVAAVAAAGDDVLAGHVGSSWGAVLKPLAWQGLIVQGPPRQGRTTFVRPDVAVPGWAPPADPDEAARRAVPAYLAAHGPSTVEAFDAWLLRGATPRARLRRWFADTDEALTTVDVEGRACVARARDVDEITSARAEHVVRLLPAFDQFVLGPGTADPHVVPPAHRAQVSRAAGWIAPVVVTADGVVGTWSPKGGVTVELFADAPAPRARDLAAEVRRVGDLLGL